MKLFDSRKDKTHNPTQSDTQWVQHQAPTTPAPSAMMNQAQLKRTHEARRMAQTKRTHIEESITRLRYQQNWLSHYSLLALRLKEEKNRLYLLGKERSQLYAAEQDLNRFEAFEGIMGLFEQLRLIRQMAEANRTQQRSAEQEVDELRRRCAEQAGIEEHLASEYAKSSNLLHKVQHRLAQANYLDGQEATLATEVEYIDERMATHTARREALDKQATACHHDNEARRAQLEQLGIAQQSVEMHRPMLEHAESVLLRLDRLSELRASTNNFSRMQKERSLRQHELNEQLGQVFAQYQEAESRMQMLTEELAMFRTDTDAESNIRLQENALRLEGRKQLLQSALSLWLRISSGYTIIEDTRMLIHSLRQKIGQSEANQTRLEAEVGLLKQLCQEKERNYLLGKGQEVIQLRASLSEGTGCPVCGAPHHPYHSSCMLEQTTLINSLKRECEMARAELSGKEALLTQLGSELSEMRGQHQAAEQSLITSIHRQKEEVADWQLYKELDPSFATCSAEVNREGRTSLLRQLLVNVARDAQEARSQLQAFNRRQSRIADISRQIATLEQRKSELSVWLNEVNTNCQVIAGQVDYLRGNLDRAHRRFARLYEQLNTLISLPGWLAEWEADAERLKQRILRMAEGWATTRQHIEHTSLALAQGVETLKTLRAEADYEAQIVSNLAAHRAHHLDGIATGQQQRGQFPGGIQPAELYANVYDQLNEQKQQLHQAQAISHQLQDALAKATGRLHELQQRDEEMGAQLLHLQQTLDVWMRNYNATNPPVQYAELERLFGQAAQWHLLRTRLRTLFTEIAICQDRVNQMQSELTAMQADAGRAPIQLNEHDPQHELQQEEVRHDILTSIATQEQKLRDINLQLARYDIIIQAHSPSALPHGDEEEQTNETEE